jgi:hypothetical protein
LDISSLLLPGEHDLPEAMYTVRAVYAEIDTAAATFASQSGVTCPAGCGLCCQGPSPAVSVAEAEYLARYAIATISPRIEAALERDEESRAPCPFYDPDTPLHCTVYHARPLVCRAFGYAGSRDRVGRLAYRLCRHMAVPPLFSGERAYTVDDPVARTASESIDRSSGSLPLPPDLPAYRMRIPATLTDRETLGPLDLTVARMLRVLLLRRQLLTAERFAHERSSVRGRPVPDPGPIGSAAQ